MFDEEIVISIFLIFGVHRIVIIVITIWNALESGLCKCASRVGLV